MSETPNTVHGRLLEAAHISGYTLERACGELEWLLDDDRWKSVGGGFDDINAFLATIDLSEFRIAVEQRKKLARRLSEIEASQRAIGRTLGVAKDTIARDLRRPGASATGPSKNANKHDEQEPSNGAFAPTWFQSDVDPSQEAKRIVRNHERDQQRDAKYWGKVASIASGAVSAGEFDIVCADPPWQYNNSGFEQSAESHYPTMDTDAICDLPESDVSFPKFADACVLFLWATAPLLPDALDVMKAWDFEYKAHRIWLKDRAPGLGWWFDTRHELLLVGVRGDVMHPRQKLESVFLAAVSDHSRKPATAYEAIEAMYPGLRYVELFARSPRDGWAIWGNEL